MTLDVEKTTADGRRALRKARRRAAAVVGQARAIEVPTVSDLGHRIDQGTAVLEHAVDRQVRAAKRATRAGKDSGRRSALRATGIVLVFGLGVAAVVVIARNRRSTDATETPDPFGAALREAEDARRAASASVRA